MIQQLENMQAGIETQPKASDRSVLKSYSGFGSVLTHEFDVNYGHPLWRMVFFNKWLLGR